MRHNRPWEESWYDRSARENNPLRDDFTIISSDLESSVNGTHIDGHYSSNALTRGAGIGSSLLLAAYMLIMTACSSGQAAPTPSPTSTAQRAISTPAARQETSTPQPTLEATVEATATSTPTQPQISVTIDKPTYDVIFPFKEPSNTVEKALLKITNEVTYMKFIRFQENIKWTLSLTDLVYETWDISKWTDFFKRNQELGKLIPYVPLEDITKYQQGQPNYKGTKVDEAKPIYFQQTATRGLIPIENPDMDEQLFSELKKKYSNPFVALALSKGLSEDIVSKLHIFSKDSSLEGIDRRIISLLANSHPEVQRVLSDQLMEEGSTPFGSVPASFNYSRSDIETLDSILKPFEAMKNLPFVEGKNVLLFYRPTYSFSRDEKFDTKEFLDRFESIKVLDLAYDIQTKLVGYRKFGGQKRLFLDSFDLHSSGGQPVVSHLINKDFTGTPILVMGRGNILNLMYSFLIPGTRDVIFSEPLELLTLDSMELLIYNLTIEELFNAHVGKFGPEAQETLGRRYKGVIDEFALAFKYVSYPKTDNLVTGISIIHKVGENNGEDFYKNFFRIWNNVEPYVNANPGVVGGSYPYNDFLKSDENSKRINNLELVGNTLIISAFSAATGNDLRQQFSEYRMIETHQGLFDKTIPFFRDVLDYSTKAQK